MASSRPSGPRAQASPRSEREPGCAVEAAIKALSSVQSALVQVSAYGQMTKARDLRCVITRTVLEAVAREVTDAERAAIQATIRCAGRPPGETNGFVWAGAWPDGALGATGE